jgi:hypothetical protein
VKLAADLNRREESLRIKEQEIDRNTEARVAAIDQNAEARVNALLTTAHEELRRSTAARAADLKRREDSVGDSESRVTQEEGRLAQLKANFRAAVLRDGD